MTSAVAQLAPLAKVQFNQGGVPLNGGKLFTYAAGTTTKQNTYTDETGATPNTNPIILDSNGQASVWCDITLSYKFTLSPSTDTDPPTNAYWTVDNIGGQLFNASVATQGAGMVGYGSSVTYPSNTVGSALNAVSSLSYCANLAALRAVTVGGLAQVAGAFSQGDGGGGTYWYNSSDTTSSDNGGSIIVATNGYRWYLTSQNLGSVRQFSAKGDGSTNDGPAVRNAVAATAKYFGGAIRVPYGTFALDATSGASIALSTPVTIIGDSGLYSCLQQSGSGSSDDGIVATPAVSGGTSVANWSMWKLQGFSFTNPSTGSRSGRHGVYMNTGTAGAQIPKPIVRDVEIGSSAVAGGLGIWHYNLSANNYNGGMYAGLFDNNIISGGMRLDNSGDSICVTNNIISGLSSCTNVGLYVSLTQAPNASLLEVQGNNITTPAGAINILAGSRFRILGNNIENSVAGAASYNSSAVVNLSGTNGALYGGVVKENLISGFGSTTATTLLHMSNCFGTSVEDNVFLAGVPAITSNILIDANCYDVRIGPNTFDNTVGITDNGVGTMGLVKTLTLSNSWVSYGVGTTALQVVKAVDGMVHLFGSIKSGVTTAGTYLTTLPARMWPSAVVAAPAFTLNVSAASVAQVTIDASGNVALNYAQASRVDINVTFPAANLANGTSSE